MLPDVAGTITFQYMNHFFGFFLLDCTTPSIMSYKTMDQLYIEKDIISNETTEEKEIRRKNLFKTCIKSDIEYVTDTIIFEILYPTALFTMRQGADHETKSVKLWALLDHTFKPLKTNVKVKTLFTGFWNAETKTHTFEPFKEAGSDMLLNVINEKIHPMRLSNISDRTKSFKMVFELIIPPKGSV